MPATASLRPRKVKSRARIDKAPWCVNVPPELSETGKRQRLFFDTERAADAECERLKAKRHNLNASQSKLSAPRLIEAARCFELLEDFPDLSLEAVVRTGLDIYKQRNASLPFGKLFDQFIESKKHRSQKYLIQLRWAKERLQSLNEVLASELTVRGIEEALQGFKPTVRNAFHRYIRAVLNFGLRRDYLNQNPAIKLEATRVIRRETKVFSPRQTTALLKIALEHDLPLLPYFIFGFFTGVRPDGELGRLDWSMVHWTERELVLPAEITKKKRKRAIDLSENAMAWLEAYRKRRGKVTGSIVKFSAGELRNHRREASKRAKIPWIHSGMRHSFCSYHLAFHENIDRLVMQAGHDDTRTMWEHYHAAVSKKDAAKFWKITPPKRGRRVAENVVPFRSTAAA
jgi:integrase